MAFGTNCEAFTYRKYCWIWVREPPPGTTSEWPKILRLDRTEERPEKNLQACVFKFWVPHRSVTFSRFNIVCLLLWLHLQHCLLQTSLRDTQPDRTNWLEAPTDFLRPSAGTIRHCWINSRESSSRLHDLEVLLASSARNHCRLLCSHSKDTRGELYKQRKRDHMGHFSCFSPLTANYMTFLLQRQCTFFLFFRF